MDLTTSTIIRFLSGECDTEELKAVNSYIERYPDKAEELFNMEWAQIQLDATQMNPREVNNKLNRLHHRISRIKQRKIFIRKALSAAASVILLCTMVWLAKTIIGSESLTNHTIMLTAQAAKDKPMHLQLEDGTNIWLKPGAKLVYPAQFGKEKRNVKLYGEGYFEVSKDKHKPFTVETEHATVRVLGTKFGFGEYTDKQLAVVSLIEGSVEMGHRGDKSMLCLKPGQRASLYYPSGRMSVESANTALDAVWHNKLIPFTNSNIISIANTLKQVYGIKVYISPSIDRKKTYSGVVPLTEDIDSAIQLIQTTVPIEFKHNNGTVIITDK